MSTQRSRSRKRRLRTLPAILAQAALLASLLIGMALSGAGAAAGMPTLQILHSTPAAGATDVPANGFISLVFDRAVVPLNSVGVAGAMPAATISPSVAGKGRWINTSTWTYQLANGLALATRYRVTPRLGLTAQDGARLTSATPFTFDTVRPLVISTTPTGGTRYALPGDAVQVTFNQPMRHSSAEHAFSMTAGGQSIAGRFTWNDKRLATQPNGANAVVPPQPSGSGQNAPPAKDAVMTFHPARPLPLGASVHVSIAAGVQGTGGPLGMAAPYSWRYAIAGPLTVTGSTPDNGATGADLSQGAQITFSAPAGQAAVQRDVRVQPKLDFQDISVSDAGTTLTISGNFLPATAYTISIATRPLGTAGQSLPHPYTLHFVTQHALPSIQLVSQGQAAVYDAYLGANVYARVTNIPTAAISLYRLSAAQFMRLSTNPPSNWQGAPPAGAPLVASYYTPANAPEDRTILIKQPLVAQGRPVPPGYYLVDAGSSGGGTGDHLLVLITRTNVTLKIGQRQAFVWATDLKSGKPVAGQSVHIVDSSGRVWASGTTNADGIFQATVTGLRSDDSLLQHTLEAQLTRGDDVSACGLDWNNGVGPWDYNLPFSTYQQPVRIYLSTDRPIYRPGQPVFFKGIARRDNDGRYTLLPAGTPVQVQIQDARQNTVFNQRLTVDAFGAFNGKMAISAAAALGYYTINAGVGVSTASNTFQVAEYKAPTYNVLVISDRGANANYVQNQTVGVQVHARYYFGAALAHAPVQWDLTQDDFIFTSPLFPDYDFVDYDYALMRQQTFFGQKVTEGTGRTNGQGDFHFGVPANIAKDQLSQQFTLEAIVTGPDNQQVSERTQVVVHKAALYVGLRPADYLGTTGTSSAINVVTVADDGTRTIGGVPVTANFYKRAWFSSYVRDANGFYYFQTRYKDTLVATTAVRTDANGRATVTFTPKDGGEYRVVATAVDSAGRKAVTATDLWVAAAQEQYVPWQTQNNDRIQLVADKKSYLPGQVAHILVTAPLAGMTALITVERGGVLMHRVITLPTNSSQISVPILGYYAPDVYVSVTLVKGPGADTSIPVWKMGYLAIPVDTSARSLHVAISASVPKAAPGQKVTFTIHATNAQGQGVRAQLAVSLVDKAVLALAQSSTTGLMDTFYQQRELGVESAATLSLYIDRLNLNQKVGSKGGSGGGGGSSQGPTRQKFPDTAYWNPSVVTDANGNARLTITLPDNLTTWTFSAIGGTTSTLVGQQAMDLISTKDLLLEPALPRFLTLGDRTESGAVVTNLTGGTQQVQVRLHVSGAGTPADYSAVVRVPSGNSQLVTWPIRAGAVGTQTYLFTAQGTGNALLSDRLQVSLPVQPNSMAQVDATSGLVGASTTQTVQVPAGAQPGEGGLTIDLAPSLVSGLGAAADFLIAYPYNCAEQTTSRYYGLIEALRLSPSISGVSAAVTAQVPAIVQTALQQLYNQQNSDGGWGWWPEDQSSPYMTAYVLEGLTALSGRGYTVDAKVLGQAVSYLRGWALNPPGNTYLPNATSTLDLQAYSAYVLGEAGRSDSGLTSTLYTHRQNMLPFARAYLALASARIAGARDPRVQNLLATIEGAAQQFDAQAHWSDQSPDWIMMDDDVSATAIALDALVRLEPSNPLVPGAVRWLMTQRIDGAWSSTQSTALALRALVDYTVQARPLSGAARYTVAINGNTVSSGIITEATRGALRSVTVPLSALGSMARVTIHRQGGSGQMAYTLTLRTYLPVTTIGAGEHGIVVTRQYQPIQGGHGQAGSELRVVLTVTAPEDLYYLTIEDPLPAGAEPVDPSLRTTSVLSGITAQTTIPKGTSDLGWYVSHVEFRDDRTALFADYLPAGSYQYSYQIHLTSAGTYHALPTQAQLLYFPDVRGHGAGQLYAISAG